MSMQNGRKNNFGFALFLSLAFILVLSSSAHAADCGTVHANTGTCSSPSGGTTKTVACTTQDDAGEDCCNDVSHCAWTEHFAGSGDYYCKQSAGVHQVTCSSYNNNEVGCKEMECVWTPAGSPQGCSGSSGGPGYGEPCVAGSCAKCLVCDPASNRCTQRPGICTTTPAIYVMPAPSNNTTFGNLNPQSVIANLESGTQGVQGGAVVGSSSEIYKVGWFSDWKAMGLIGVAIVCSIIALAAMIGKAFNLPEIKAFANNEIKQAVISVLLIATLIALVAFFNQVAIDAIAGADLPVNCNVPEPCYVAAAKTYLTTIIDIGKSYSQDNLHESIVKMRRATYGYNINANIIYLLYAGFSIRFNAGDSLVAERHGALFSQASKILASLTAQRYFIDVVTFGIAPLFLLLGIVLRTFFFTRKLGGLLLAIAISLFIIYPLTYAFAWYTLNVTVYGERTLAVADPNCPNECTATYPVAFFSNSTTGELVQFPTTQAIVRTGINSSNWGSGGPDLNGDSQPDFPGLVACRDLSSIAISALNSCSDCPDYCRDVPFPTSMPGCNITKCSTCNPGCKIVRQRLNCNTDPSCPVGSCPDICRTAVPTENKCFNNESGGVIAANMSISCASCEQFPAWCRFLFKNSSGLYPVYDDPVLDAACIGVGDPAKCPSQCQYITQIGTDTLCDNICSVKDANKNAVTCPAQCRVMQLFNKSWSGIYDTDPPNYTKACNKSPEMAAACKVCTQHPECMITVLPVQQYTQQYLDCAAYPTTNKVSALCLDCPDYCRRANFTGFFQLVSNVKRDSTGLPDVCNPVYTKGINCSTSGNPPACNITCRTTEVPLICRPFDANHGLPSLCNGCPDNARYKVNYTKNGPGYSCQNGIPVPQALAANEQGATLANIAVPTGAAQLAGAGAGSGAAMAFAGAEGSGTILLDGDTVTIVSTRIDPNTSVYANGSTVLVGWCNATLTTGNGASGANSGAALAHKPGTLYLDSPSNQQLSGTIYLAAGELIYNFTWYRNGTVNYTGQTGAIPAGMETPIGNIQPADLFAGDNWALSCKARHEHSGFSTIYSNWMNSSTVVLLSPDVPIVQNSSILPTNPYRTDTLQGFCNASYGSNPSAMLTYEYRWYLNGGLNASGAYPSTILQGTMLNIANISSAELYKHQNWTFSCRANLSASYGNWLNSSNVTISPLPPEAQCKNTLSAINLSAGYSCDNAACPESTCQAKPIYVTLPNEDNNAACQDANVTECPYGCRVLGLNGYLDPVACSGCASLPSYCFVTQPTVPLCNEYIGNGRAACHSAICLPLSLSDCSSMASCTWNSSGGFCDRSTCTPKAQAACTGECIWTTTDKYAKIGERGTTTYSNPLACRQCPEECRLDGYTGNCGVKNNGPSNDYVDCSVSACASTCRIPEPLDTSTPPNPSCQTYPEGGQSCKDCPVLCRRSSDTTPYVSNCPDAECMLSDNPASGCMDKCRLPDAPIRACDGCFNCNMDCTYYPAIRTDCGDVCSDAALAGPVDISPSDFIKKLSGATTSADGEWARSIGILYIPAVVLPLFCIVIVIAFVRIFSPILGGDIEIPGIGRII